MASSGTAFTPSRRRMQNRGFISQLKLWGWVERKTSGEWTVMQAPSGAKVQVRSAHTHDGNTQETYAEVLDIIGVTWDEFAARGRDESEHQVGTILRSLADEPEGRKREFAREINRRFDEVQREQAEAERQRQAEQKSQRKAERKAAAAAPVREDTPVEAAQQESGRGTADKVFGVILGHSGPITNAQIGEVLGIDNNVRVGNATNYLFQLGVIDRVKRGVWQRKHEYSAHDMTIDVVSRNIEQIPRESRPAEPPTPLPTKATTDRALREDRDRLLDDVLDQLLPDGFMGRHLSLIARWRDETLAMIDLVESDR